METTTPFDLNQNIQRWRENLAQSPAFRSENLYELETHLRDSIAALQSRELSAEEAFLVATRRIGQGCALDHEFGKVNGRAVWLDRGLWMLIGFQFWMIISIAHSNTQRVVLGVLGWTVEGKTGVSVLGLYLLVILLPVLLVALGLFLAWRILLGREDKAGDGIAGLLVKPQKLAFVSFLATFCLGLFAEVVMTYWIEPVFYNTMPALDWKLFLMNAAHLMPSVVGAVLIWILAGERLQCRMKQNLHPHHRR